MTGRCVRHDTDDAASNATPPIRMDDYSLLNSRARTGVLRGQCLPILTLKGQWRIDEIELPGLLS